MANIKISELNELETRNSEDLLAIVDTNNNETKKIKVENLINENVELIAVSPTAPSECSLGDKYFNTTSNKIYTAIATDTWSSTGENAVEGILYIVFNEQSTYAYNGTTLVSVGGGSGSSDIVIIGDESETTEDTKLLVDTSGTTDTLKYKDNNTFTELQIKALDSMPVGTIVDYDGQTSDIPAGWETYGTGQIKKTSETRPLASHTVNAYSESESNAYSCDYSNKAFGGVVLYNNASGSNANITLSDSAGNYDYIEIFFKSNDNIYSSVKGINGTIIMCHIVSTITNTQYWYNPVLTTYSINGTSLSISNKVSYNITNNWTKTDSLNTQNNIYITKVIGYKTGLFPTQQSTRSTDTKYSGDIEEKKDIVIDDGGEEKPIDDGNDENNK